MNQEYKIDSKKIILSPEEHELVSKDIANGKTIVFLRNGTLAININFIRTINPTDELTEIEEKSRIEVMRLPPEQRMSKNRMTGFKVSGFKKAINENDKECARCKKIHFIPGDRIYCLPCNHIIQKEKI